MKSYTVYTDGGCIKNPGGKGGIGVVILDDKENQLNIISKGYKSTTNNRMELKAAIEGLKEIPEFSHIILYSDSQYLIKSMNGEYQKGKNIDLWKELDYVSKNKLIEWVWVKGHSTNKFNNLCDKMAVRGYSGNILEEDKGYNKTQKRLF